MCDEVVYAILNKYHAMFTSVSNRKQNNEDKATFVKIILF